MVSVLGVNATLSFPRVCFMFAVLKSKCQTLWVFCWFVCFNFFTNIAAPPNLGVSNVCSSFQFAQVKQSNKTDLYIYMKPHIDIT